MLQHNTGWRHQMETFSALLALCAGNSPVLGEFPAQRPVTLSFDVSFDLRVSKRLSKHSWGWWSGTQSSSLWRHCNKFPIGQSEEQSETNRRTTLSMTVSCYINWKSAHKDVNETGPIYLFVSKAHWNGCDFPAATTNFHMGLKVCQNRGNLVIAALNI